MRVFLTGVSGYLGGVLVEHLARLPEIETITGVDSTAPKTPFASKVRFVRMDIRSPELMAAMAGHDVVIHTACVMLWSARMSARERDDINLNGVRHVAQAALASQAAKFIHASSMAAYDPALASGKTAVAEDFPLGQGNSRFYYWNAKAAAERVLTEVLQPSATLLTLLRPIYIIGPRNRVGVRNYQDNAVNFPGQNPRRQFVHEDDVAAAFVLALREKMPGPFNVVPDDFMRMREVWKAVGARFVPTVPARVARLIAWFRWRYLGSPVHPSWVEDILVDFTGSNAKLKAAGWRPRWGSADALRAAL